MSRRNRSAQQQKIRSRLPHHRESRFVARSQPSPARAPKRVRSSGRVHRDRRRVRRARSGPHVNRSRVVVERDRAHRRAKPEKQVAHIPARRDTDRRENSCRQRPRPRRFPSALSPPPLRPFPRALCPLGRRIGFLVIRKSSIRQIRVAASHQTRSPASRPSVPSVPLDSSVVRKR